MEATCLAGLDMVTNKTTCYAGLDPRYMECLPRELRECFGYVAYKNNAGAVVEVPILNFISDMNQSKNRSPNQVGG